MRIDTSLLGWGVFLVLAGLIPLAVQQAWIPDDIRWWELWPLILVGIGVGLLLRRTSVAPLGGLIVAGTFGLMLGGVLASGIAFSGSSFGCLDDRSGEPFADQRGSFSSSSAAVGVELPCGDLTVTTTGGSDWTITGSDHEGRVPDIDSEPGGLDVRGADVDGDFFRGRSDWDLVLPTAVPFDLDVTLNAGSADLDLADATLEGVGLTVNAGSATVDLSAAEAADGLSVTVNAGSAGILLPSSALSGSMTVNAGSISVCAPDDVALRITTNDNIIATFDLSGAGLTEVSDNVWESPDWASASTRIELSMSANAGSISLDPEDGCK